MYLMSRLRSNADEQSFIKATMNPEPESWLMDFVEWYLTPEGYADPSKSGKIRWFISDEDGQLAWADTPDELRALYGQDVDPMSFTFIQASVADNPVLCKLQPGYLTALKNLPRVDREILLYGNWLAVPSASGYYKREWTPFIDRKDVPRLKKVVRCWDLASSLESEALPNPDFTACTKAGIGEDGNIYILHAHKFRDRPAGVAREMQRFAQVDGKGCIIGLPLDPGSSGRVAFESYARPLILNHYKVKKNNTRGSKVDRFLPFSNAAENGLVYIVKGDWNKIFIKELEMFTGEGRKEKDDLVDSTADTFINLTSGKKSIEKFKMNPASLTKANQFGGF